MSETTSRIGGAVQQQQNDTPEKMIWAAEGHIAAVLPSHLNAKSWLGVAIAALTRDEALYKVAQRNPGSLMGALLRAAQDGLRPGTEEFYLVRYGSEVQGLRGYQGELALIYRAGAVSSVVCEIVYENDVFSYEPGSGERPTHRFDVFGDRGEMKGAYAYGIMRDGTISNIIVKTKAEILKHRDASPSFKSESESRNSPWMKWPKSMWMKTTIHELQKWVPTSAEYITQRLDAQQAVELETVRARAAVAAAKATGAIETPKVQAQPVAPPVGLDGSGPAPAEVPATAPATAPAEQPKTEEKQAPASTTVPAETQQQAQDGPKEYDDPYAGINFDSGEITEPGGAPAVGGPGWTPPGRDETTTTKGRNRR